jgi:hypothetical protein
MKCHTNVNFAPPTQLPPKFSYIVAIFIHNHLESPNDPIYSERQKYGINSLKIKQNCFQKNLWTGQVQFIKIHVLV